jgi:hypothetical protein
VFLAALSHDLAKVAVDQTVTLYALNHLEQTWPVAKLWPHPERRPEPFDGRIVPIETAEEEGADNMRQAPTAITSPLQPGPLQPARQQNHDPLPEEHDPAPLLNVLPALTQDRDDNSVKRKPCINPNAKVKDSTAG